MSLGVWLTMSGEKRKRKGSGIFIRENGQTKEITKEEWNKKFPGREPVIVKKEEETNEVFSWNITHNLSEMADEAGIYHCLWHPDEMGIENAAQLIFPLRKGLEKLQDNPEYFKTFNSLNGWGIYENLVEFVREYIKACIKYPSAEVHVSR